jgi:hypothetical protein
MKRWFAAVIFVFVVAFAVMFSYGSTISDSCITIGGQKSCWKNYAVTINSELCTKNPCTASPELQKHNSIVDAISAACDSAKQNDFSDAALNSEIENALKQISSYELSARVLCSDPGIILAKKFYD